MKMHVCGLLFASTVALSAVSQDAVGQVAGFVPGQVSQLPPTPVPQTAVPDIRISRPANAANDEPHGAAVLIHELRISGQTRFTQRQLIAAAGFKPDQLFDLADLRRMALLITRFYNARGYIVAQAYVPAQQINAGSVTITVIEGHYGAITVHNTSRVRNGTVHALFKGIDPGDSVEASPLERRLLLMSDLPGARVNSTLSPGSAVGTSDLLVNVTPGRSISGDVEASNAGSP